MTAGEFPAIRRLLLGFFFGILCMGCHPLPPGDLSAVKASSSPKHAGTVYLVRGWRDLYSSGIDQLAEELRDAGLAAHVYREAQWRELADSLARAYGKAQKHGPLILIGFSFGADDVIRISCQLQHDKIPVDLLIAIDPVTPPPVTKNVRVCYDYFQTNGFWDVFPWFRGVPLQSDGANALTNVDLRRTRPDLVELNTAHSNIAANPKLHREIIRRVLEACNMRGRT